MSLSIPTLCRMSLGMMSSVEFYKRLCFSVDFRGPHPYSGTAMLQIQYVPCSTTKFVSIMPSRASIILQFLEWDFLGYDVTVIAYNCDTVLINMIIKHQLLKKTVQLPVVCKTLNYFRLNTSNIRLLYLLKSRSGIVGLI